MASLRNAMPQRTYRERAQPKSREKLGLLEKHKDYAARARDYNEKKKRLKILREKAANRNPDEFHFGMMSSRTKNGGKVADRGNKALSQEVVKLMKTQDAGYLRTVRERVRRQRERLEEGLTFTRPAEGAIVDHVDQKHTVFVEDEEQQREFDPEVYFDTDADGVLNAYNRQRRPEVAEVDTEDLLDDDQIHKSRSNRKKQEEAEELAKKQAAKDAHKSRDARQRRKAMLEVLRTQEEQLLIAEQQLDKQRGQMDNTVGGINKNGTKFKIRERKR